MKKCTIVQDSHGCIHIWKYTGTFKYHPTLPTLNNSEADLFVQSCSAVETISDYLTKDQLNELNKGYPITSSSIPDEYFNF